MTCHKGGRFGRTKMQTTFKRLESLSRLMIKPTKWLCAQRRLRSAWNWRRIISSIGAAKRLNNVYFTMTCHKGGRFGRTKIQTTFKRLEPLSRLLTKPTKWLCAQRRLSSTWASTQSDKNLRCALNRYLRTQAFFMQTAKTLIRLGGCWVHNHTVGFVVRRLTWRFFFCFFFFLFSRRWFFKKHKFPNFLLRIHILRAYNCIRNCLGIFQSGCFQQCCCGCCGVWRRLIEGKLVLRS